MQRQKSVLWLKLLSVYKTQVFYEKNQCRQLTSNNPLSVGIQSQHSLRHQCFGITYGVTFVKNKPQPVHFLQWIFTLNKYSAIQVLYKTYFVIISIGDNYRRCDHLMISSHPDVVRYSTRTYTPSPLYKQSASAATWRQAWPQQLTNNATTPPPTSAVARERQRDADNS